MTRRGGTVRAAWEARVVALAEATVRRPDRLVRVAARPVPIAPALIARVLEPHVARLISPAVLVTTLRRRELWGPVVATAAAVAEATVLGATLFVEGAARDRITGPSASRGRRPHRNSRCVDLHLSPIAGVVDVHVSQCLFLAGEGERNFVKALLG
jgi:hypothetical protein